MKLAIIAMGFGAVTVAPVLGQAPTSSQPSAVPLTRTATAGLVAADGKSVGRAQLRQTSNGVLLELNLEGAPPGIHGLHIHEVGRCEGPTFASAGGHFNPASRQHGFLNARGAHGGDLPNLNVPSTGTMTLEVVVGELTLDAGPRSLLDQDGSAIVIHAGKDDYSTDPSGGSGDRIACGQIVSTETKTK